MSVGYDTAAQCTTLFLGDRRLYPAKAPTAFCAASKVAAALLPTHLPQRPLRTPPQDTIVHIYRMHVRYVGLNRSVHHGLLIAHQRHYKDKQQQPASKMPVEPQQQQQQQQQ